MQPNSIMHRTSYLLVVRRAGRKTLYMAGGVQMFSAQASPINLISFQTLNTP